MDTHGIKQCRLQMLITFRRELDWGSWQMNLMRVLLELAEGRFE